MFSYITEPLLRYFRSTAEPTHGRKRNHARMFPVNSESDGPVTKKLCRSRSAVVLPSPVTAQGQGGQGFGNYVHDWFAKISQMAAKPTMTINLGQVQSMDFPDEEAENERQASLLLTSDRKIGMPRKPPFEAMPREPLHSTQPWKVISNGNEHSWNGNWDQTYQISGAVGSDASVRRKQKNPSSWLPQRKEEDQFGSDDDFSRLKSALQNNKLKKLRKRQGKKIKTPLEPIRLDEKERYRLLLDQYKVGVPLASTSKKRTEHSGTYGSGCAVGNGHFNVEKLPGSSHSYLANRLHSGSHSSGIRRDPDRRSFNAAGKYLSLGQQLHQPSASSSSKSPFSKPSERLQIVQESSSSAKEGGSRIQDRESYSEMKRMSSDDSGRGTEHSSSKEVVAARKSVSTFETLVFSQEWLKTLQVSIDDCYKTRTEKQDLLEKRTSHLREKREAKIFAENRKSLHKLRKSLKLRSPDASEEEDDTSQLPELTPEMERKIEEALRPNPGDEVLCEEFRLSIARRDMETLSGLNWLNDEIINFYMNMLMERGKNDNFPSCYAFNTFFYPKLIAGGHSALKRWTRKVDVFSHDFILIPVHLGMHWCLAVIDFRQKKIQYYDSMGGQNNECLNALRIYLQDESRDKKKAEYDMTDWKLETVKNIPQQMNGSDCGMFTLKYAEYITRSAKITFSQRHMPYFRRRMVYEIATKSLL